jgi:hypothetical protein
MVGGLFWWKNGTKDGMMKKIRSREGLTLMRLTKEAEKQSARTAKRSYQTPVLNHLGDWQELTLGGGAVVSSDNPSGNTKTGR